MKTPVHALTISVVILVFSWLTIERANADERSFHRSVKATNDDYMKEAMKKIRQDKRTHSDSITSFNGTWLYNKTLESL